jgi:ketosteroid isomerase-like protein
MTKDDVQAWLDAYQNAWRSNDQAVIRELFAPDATYAFHPYDEPVRGRDAIVAAWLKEPDDPSSWEASYAPSLIQGRRAIATGETRYLESGPVFSNLFDIEFGDDGRCTRFVEWFVEHPSA